MLGRTHCFIGIAAALALFPPQTMPALVTGMGAAAVGSVISDIDSGTSQAHQDADRVITAASAAAVLVILAEYRFHLGIYERLLRDSSIGRVLAGAAAFIIICAYGRELPHRSFMHSFLALLLLTSCMGIIYPDAVPYFAAAFVSHLGLDLLNRRQEKLLWPLKKGFCLRLCAADGWVNGALMAAGPVWIAFELISSASARRLAERIAAILLR